LLLVGGDDATSRVVCLVEQGVERIDRAVTVGVGERLGRGARRQRAGRAVRSRVGHREVVLAAGLGDLGDARLLTGALRACDRRQELRLAALFVARRVAEHLDPSGVAGGQVGDDQRDPIVLALAGLRGDQPGGCGTAGRGDGLAGGAPRPVGRERRLRLVVDPDAVFAAPGDQVADDGI
jgi:hypothetical protein